MGFTRFLLGFTQFYWVLSKLSGFRKISSRFCWVLPGFSGFCYFLSSLSGFYKVSIEFY